jgi:hypothetical protein
MVTIGDIEFRTTALVAVAEQLTELARLIAMECNQK